MSQRNGIYFGSSVDNFINVIYVLIISLNFIGNGLIIYLITRYRQLRTPINFLLLNLSVSDIVAGLSLFPYIFVRNIAKMPNSEDDLRLICSLTEGLSIYFIAVGVSLSTLCAVSIYRYVLVRFPLRALWTRSMRTVKLIIAALWVLSITVIFPSAVTYKYSPKLDVCIRDWRGMNDSLYRALTWLLTIVLPIVFLLLCYLALRLARRRISRDQGCSSNRIRMMKRSEQLVKMLIANFIICWTPFFIYWGIATFSLSFPETYAGQTKMLKWVRITVLFSAINCSVDPILFAAGNRELRVKAKKVLFKVLLMRYTSTTIVGLRVRHNRQSCTNIALR